MAAESVEEVMGSLAAAMASYREARSDAQRRARSLPIYSLGSQAQQASDGLKAALNRGWDWLDANPEHARFEEAYAQWLEYLHQYEALEDILRAAHQELRAAAHQEPG
jgi:hypothetical protein